MIFKEKEITLKNGQCCILRNVCSEDAERLINYLKETSIETPYLIREPCEVTLTPEQETAFIEKQLNAERELMLIGTVEGNHAGTCSMTSVGSFQRYSHRCSIAIALYQKYWGLGIGRAMLETLLDVCRDAGYEQAELSVVSTNKRAAALYKSLGFEIFGKHPHTMKYKDGTYADELLMLKML